MRGRLGDPEEIRPIPTLDIIIVAQLDPAVAAESEYQKAEGRQYECPIYQVAQDRRGSAGEIVREEPPIFA